MKQRILISIGAIVLGASTLTLGYAASKSREEGTACERMMREHMGKAEMNCQGMGRDGMGRDGMGKEGNSMMDRNHMGMTGKGDSGMLGKHHMGMMGSEMPKECEEMMRKHGMPATESLSATPTAPAN